MGVGLGPNPNEQGQARDPRLSTGYPPDIHRPRLIHSLSTSTGQSYPQVIHQISTGQNCCVKATLKKDLVDNRVNSSEITLEQSSCESYSVVEITVTPPFKAGCRALKTVYNGGPMVRWCIRTTTSRTQIGLYKRGKNWQGRGDDRHSSNTFIISLSH